MPCRLIEDPSALAFRSEKLGGPAAVAVWHRVYKFSYAEKLAGDKESFRNALLLWLSFWRDVLLRAGGAATPSANTGPLAGDKLARAAPSAFRPRAACVRYRAGAPSASMPNVNARLAGRDPAQL